jgi:alkanesulfonate monooxygenase SsuD/methylene tetrahydromethanopterin reductase-like flavin-dependent oxidoreductase (luciferase family)
VGKHYAVSGLTATPAPVRAGGPPLLVGGGGPRILRLAGREAEIVGLVPRSRADGAGLDLADLSNAAFADKVRWVREGAGARFDALELNTLIQVVAFTDDRSAAAATIARDFSVPADAVLDSPYTLIGNAAQIEGALLERRERFELSYLVVFERDMEGFAPIAQRLAGR